MKKTLSFLPLVFIAVMAHAQISMPINFSAFDLLTHNPAWSGSTTPKVYAPKYLDIVSGTPYFKEIWMKSVFIVPGATPQGGFIANLDFFDNTVHFIENGVELEASTPIDMVYLEDTTINEFYHFIHSSVLTNLTKKPDLGWYQVVVNGKAALLATYSKQLLQSQPDYGSVQTHGIIKTTVKYYILKDNNLLQVKNMSSVLAYLSDKAEAIKTFSTSNNLRNNPEDYIKIVAYYNSLP